MNDQTRNEQTRQTDSPKELADAIVADIDWADTEHVVFLASGRATRRMERNSP